MSMFNSGLRLGIFAAAASALAKGAWDLVKITREQNSTTEAINGLESPNLQDARARTAESIVKIRKGHPTSTL